MRRLRHAFGGSHRLIAVGVICALVAGGTGAVAANLITGKDIKNGSIAGKDLKKKLRKKINKAGALVLGGPGPAGAQGPPGLDFTAGVAALTADPTGDGVAPPAWGERVSDGCGSATGDADLADGHLNLRLPDAAGNDSVAATFNGYNGLRLADISHVSYHAKYEQTGADQHGGTPYFRIFTDDFANSIIFSPNTQPDHSTDEGEWREYVVTEGGVRWNDDPGNSPDISWNQLIDDHGSEVISQIRIQGGCAGAFSAQTVASADLLSVVANGERTVFDFGG